MVNNSLDETLPLQVLDSNTGKTTVDLESFDEDGLGDVSEGGDFLEDTVVGGLVKGDGVLGLVLDLSLGPLLLLCGLAAAGRRGSSFSFGLERTQRGIRSASSKVA